jgi:hypothetical protein
MRKLATIFLLLVFSSSFTELGQLWKLPFLVDHFYTHQQQQGAGVVHFILEHYGADHEDADRDQDRQLPFKTPLNHPTATAMPRLAPLEIGQALPPEAPLFVSLHTSFVPSLYARQIFHPPRTV